jgi:hypothetical protein
MTVSHALLCRFEVSKGFSVTWHQKIFFGGLSGGENFIFLMVLSSCPGGVGLCTNPQDCPGLPRLSTKLKGAG